MSARWSTARRTPPGIRRDRVGDLLAMDGLAKPSVGVAPADHNRRVANDGFAVRHRDERRSVEPITRTLPNKGRPPLLLDSTQTPHGNDRLPAAGCRVSGVG